LQRSDEAEFHAYVGARLDRWRRSAYLLCQDWHLADDLVSITITRLYRHWPKVKKADNRDAYSQKVLTRSWLDERGRAWWRWEKSSPEPPEQIWAPVDRITDRDSLASMLQTLGRRQRAVLILRYYLDYSVEDTAEILRISPGTVKSQSARGLETLRMAATSPQY
jgi:RNA polymerase sigma-70 factor (sigma-E family)